MPREIDFDGMSAGQHFRSLSEAFLAGTLDEPGHAVSPAFTACVMTLCAIAYAGLSNSISPDEYKAIVDDLGTRHGFDPADIRRMADTTISIVADAIGRVLSTHSA